MIHLVFLTPEEVQAISAAGLRVLTDRAITTLAVGDPLRLHCCWWGSEANWAVKVEALTPGPRPGYGTITLGKP